MNLPCASLLLTVLTIVLLGACGVRDYRSDSLPVQHTLWDSLLQTHVTDEGWVNYQGFIADSNRLNQYLSILSNNHPDQKNWSKEEQFAYWVNAYNAFTVKVIVDNYPVVSIKDIVGGISFVNTIWDKDFIKIEDAEYSLNNIEHGILRKRYKDARIHFIVNCASVSCPTLWNRAYTADQLEAQLELAVKRFLADSIRNKLTPDFVQLSKIFSWYRLDFRKENKAIVDYINRYALITVNQDAKVEYLDYDWNLNEVENKPE